MPRGARTVWVASCLGLSMALPVDPQTAWITFLQYLDGLSRTPSVDTVPQWMDWEDSSNSDRREEADFLAP